MLEFQWLLLDWHLYALEDGQLFNVAYDKIKQLEAWKQRALDAEKPDPCSVCAGDPSSVENCICGGGGTIGDELHGFRLYCYELETKLARVEGLPDKWRDKLLVDSTEQIIFGSCADELQQALEQK